MADHQNYGDDVDAKYLLRPNTYSSVGVDDDEVFKVHRSPEYLLKLFHAIGDTISEEDLARVYSKVEEENDGKVTIEAFRIAYYDYKHGFVTDESKCC
uniref:EFHB C-terminal EF-hand domain-containing protein n=1 Tax=Corethron hystrix TaxID=216773 RepID=A0A7S1FQG6_9STRA